jgi:hypothetical protein
MVVWSPFSEQGRLDPFAGVDLTIAVSIVVQRQQRVLDLGTLVYGPGCRASRTFVSPLRNSILSRGAHKGAVDPCKIDAAEAVPALSTITCRFPDDLRKNRRPADLRSTCRYSRRAISVRALRC